MSKILLYAIVAIYCLWSGVSIWEMSVKPEGASPSILSQLWVNYGTFYGFLFAILFWFLKASGLSKLGEYLERSKQHMEYIEQNDGVPKRTGSDDN